MSPNSRLAVGVHLLAYLAMKAGTPVSSVELAGSVDTNPVVVRRLLSSLRRAGLVVATKGSSGGFALAAPAEKITLLDIYRAVEPGNELGLKRFEPNTECPVGARIGAILERSFLKAQAGMESELRAITIGEIDRQLKDVCPATAKARKA